jgi:glycerol-3-phosphate acyltransferase PlsY
MLSMVAIVLSYLLGSIPTALIAGRLLRHTDIRSEGSGNVGATNAARLLGGKVGLAVAVIDFSKGLLAALLLARIWPLPGSASAVLCASSAVVGHVFPVFAGFHGGKGVATAAGAATALSPVATPICLAVFVLVTALTGFISLASLAAAFTLPVAVLVIGFATGGPDPWILGFAIAAMAGVIVTHRSNIGRLVHGMERKTDLAALWRKQTRPADPS